MDSKKSTPPDSKDQKAEDSQQAPADALSRTPDDLEQEHDKQAATTESAEKTNEKKPSAVKRFFRRMNVYFLLFALIAAVAGAILLVGVAPRALSQPVVAGLQGILGRAAQGVFVQNLGVFQSPYLIGWLFIGVSFLEGRHGVANQLVVGEREPSGRRVRGPGFQGATQLGGQPQRVIDPEDVALDVIFEDTDILVINKTDLAPYVGASLEVMDRDSKLMRNDRPFVFTNCKTGEGVDDLVKLIHEGILFDLQVAAQA